MKMSCQSRERESEREIERERVRERRKGGAGAEALMKIVINALCWRFMIADCVRWQAAGCGKCRELNATLSHAHKTPTTSRLSASFSPLAWSGNK